MGLRIQKDHTVFLVSGAYGDIPFASERKAVVRRIARRGTRGIACRCRKEKMIQLLNSGKVSVHFSGKYEKRAVSYMDPTLFPCLTI